MDLFVLMGQRTERYEGEYGVEALACMSEAGMEENPEYLQGELATNRDSGEFTSVAIVRLAVSDTAVRNALFPERSAIPATVVA